MELDFQFSAKDLIEQGRTTRENIVLIKEWINNLGGKCISMLPDELVTIFLLSCSNDIDETKKTIKSYYNIKKVSPAIFDNRNINSEEYKLVINTTAFSSVKWPDANKCILYCKLLDTNYKNCYMEPQLKVAIMTMDSAYFENPPDEFIIVQDIKGIGLLHLTRLKLDSLKTFFSYIQEGLPLRLKSVHFVNSNYVLNKFMGIARMFIKPELYNKIHFHCGYEGLDQFIPKEYIPNDYDGDLASVKELQKNSVRKLKEMKTYWDTEETMRKKCFISDWN